MILNGISIGVCKLVSVYSEVFVKRVNKGQLVLYCFIRQYSAFIQRSAVNDKFPYKLMLCTLLESQPTMIHSRFGLRKLPTVDVGDSWPPQPYWRVCRGAFAVTLAAHTFYR